MNSEESQGNQDTVIDQEPPTTDSSQKLSTDAQSSDTTPPQNATSNHNKPGIIVLQWLTYAFWGWTIMALGTLLAITVNYFVTGAGSGNFTPYGIAAVLVLLPISTVCDLFYSKYEPLKKFGAASIVMVIHAVIFALFGIGSLIAVVFSLVSLVTSDTSSKQAVVTIISALAIFLVYAVTFIRTLRPSKLKWISRAFVFFMVAVSLAVIALSVIGPINYERVTKNDKLIVNNIQYIKDGVDNFAKTNSKLPSSLDEIEQKNDNVKKLVSKQLVTYRPDIKPSTTSSYGTKSYSKYDSYGGETYYYELCANYAKSTSNEDSTIYNDDYRYTDDGYLTYISAYSHGEGKVCYKLKTGY